MSYPRDISSSTNPGDRYAPVVIPADFVHIRVGVSPPPGVIVTIHGIPQQMPLAVAYIETIISQRFEFEYTSVEQPATYPKKSSGEDLESSCTKCIPSVSDVWRNAGPVIIPSSVLLHITELLGGYLSRTDVSALVKESVFGLLAQSLRVLYSSEKSVPNVSARLAAMLGTSRTLFSQLQLELWRLYEEESKGWSAANAGWSRYSVYLQSLIEVALAIGEVTAPIMPSLTAMAAESSSTNTDSLESKLSLTSLLSPSPTKRKKLRARRERGSSTPKRSGSPRRVSESDSPTSTSPHSSVSTGGIAASSFPSSPASSISFTGTAQKSEELLWFHRALTMSQILRYLVNSDPIGQGVTADAIADAAESLNNSTVHSRLLIVTNIPTKLSVSSVKAALTKAAASCGGLFMEDFYLPVVEVTVVKPEIDSMKLPPAQVKSEKDDQKTGSDVVRDEQEASVETVLRGYAVLQLRSRSKMDAAQKALVKSKLYVANDVIKQQDLTDISDGLFTVSTVNQTLFADEVSNVALESYLTDKLVLNHSTSDLCDGATLALTEIFHSCFFVLEQKLSSTDARHDSGYICLTGEQIMVQVTGNLLAVFFSNVRHAKKSFLDQVMYVLKRYGVHRTADNNE